MFPCIVQRVVLCLKSTALQDLGHFYLKRHSSRAVAAGFLFKDIFNAEKYRNRILPSENIQTTILKNTSELINESYLSSLNDNDFLSLLANILIYSHDRKNVKMYEKLLKHEIFIRQPRFDKVSLFYCADILKKSDFYLNDYVTALSKSLTFNWNQIISTKEDFLLFANFLSLSYSASSFIPIMNSAEKYFREHMTEFSARETGFICHVFFSTNTRLKNYSTLETLKQFLLDVLRNNSKIFLTDFNNITKTLRHANYSNVLFFEEVGDHLHDKFINESCSFVHLSNIAFTYASLHIRHEKLLSKLAAVFCNLIAKNKLDELDNPPQKTGKNLQIRYKSPRLKDMSRLIWSLATFNLTVSELLKQELIDCLHANMNQAFQYPEIFVESLLGLAMSGTYDEQLMKLLLSPDFLKFKEKRPLEQKYQLLMLRSSCLIEGGYKEVVPHVQKLADASEIGGNLSYELLTRQGLLPFIETLSSLIGDWSLFKFHFILDSTRVTDIELRVDDNGKLLKFNEDYKESRCLFNDITKKRLSKKSSILEGVLADNNTSFFNNGEQYDQIHLKSNVASFPKKVCIKIFGCNQYMLNSPMLLGQQGFEIRLLNKKGYEVFGINPFIAHQLESSAAENRKKIVTDILNDCGVCL